MRKLIVTTYPEDVTNHEGVDTIEVRERIVARKFFYEGVDNEISRYGKRNGKRRSRRGSRRHYRGETKVQVLFLGPPSHQSLKIPPLSSFSDRSFN